MPSSLAQNFRIEHSGATMKHQPIRHAPASEFEPRHVAILAYPGVALLDAVGPLEVFATANLVLAERSPRCAKPYQVEIWSEHVGAIDGSCGVSLNATRLDCDGSTFPARYPDRGGLARDQQPCLPALCRLAQAVHRRNSPGGRNLHRRFPARGSRLARWLPRRDALGLLR